MTVRIDEHGCLIVGNCALPAAVVPAVEAFYREQFEHGGAVAEEPEWEYGWEADEARRAELRPRGPRIMLDDQPTTPEAIANFPRGRRIRRRKAGPWVPVKQEGAGQ